MKFIPRTSFLFFLLFSACAISAQDDPSFRLGIKFAPNLAWLRADSKGLDGEGSKVGTAFGLLGEFAVGDKGTYYLSTGLLLTNIGGKVNADYRTAEGDTSVMRSDNVKLRYLELPLTLKLKTKSDGPMTFYGQIGFSSAIALRARSDFSRTKTKDGYSERIVVDDEDVIDDIAFFKAALVVGGGTEYKLGSVSLFAGLTYNQSFVNALDKDAKKLINPGKKSKLFADYLELSLGAFF